MILQLGGGSCELCCNLGTALAIEKHFKKPIMQIFSGMDTLESLELLKILEIAGRKLDDREFSSKLLEHFDYLDLFFAVQELMARLLFGGTPEQQETKLDKFPAGEEQKNAIRQLLGLPLKPITQMSTGTSL